MKIFPAGINGRRWLVEDLLSRCERKEQDSIRAVRERERERRADLYGGGGIGKSESRMEKGSSENEVPP